MGLGKPGKEVGKTYHTEVVGAKAQSVFIMTG